MDINNTNKPNKDKPANKPYMGNLTSAQIGSMAKAGVLGGEMVKRMVKQEEIKLMNEEDNQNNLT